MKSDHSQITQFGVCGLILCMAFPAAVYAESSAGFDTQTLKSRGLDSALSGYFADAAKFLPGRKPVNLRVNGNDLGTVTARFGEQGELCVDKDFLASAGLQIPSALAESSDSEAARKDNPTSSVAGSNPCYDYRKDYPSTVVTPLPGEERLDIVVPAEALSHDDMTLTHYEKGGTAGLVNYNVFTTKNDYDGGSDTYTQASLEEGINTHDWLFRSRQMVTKNDGPVEANSLYSYVQHTFVDKKALMQAGQINISNTLFAGSAINGAQWIPESALTGTGGSGVTVQGIAQGPQARVEVRQAGSLIYSTLVPMGPFTLDNVPITSVNTALDVTVKETNGSENHFIIPAEALHPNQLGGPQGFSMAAGQIRDIDTDVEKPYLLTAANGWKLTPWMNVGAAGMVATKYNALGGSVDISPAASTLVSMTMKASDDQRGGNTGVNGTLSASYTMQHNLSLSASASRFSDGYRELTDPLQDDFTPYNGQYSANLGWSNNMLGSFRLGYSLNQGVNGADDSRYLSLAWGKSFSRVSVSVNWQNQLNRKDSDDHYHSSLGGQQLYVNVSVPFGSQHVNAYWRKQGDSENAGVQTSGNITREASYSIAAERDVNDGENSFNGSISDNLHYTQLGLSAGVNGDNSKNYGATLNGGMLVHSQGVTFSPYNIDDTFALATLDDKVSNVEISTPSGEVWTDHWGRAVIPSLPAYRNSRIEINTETLPKNIDVNNGISTIANGHGAVSQVTFGVINVRRAMLTLTGSGKQMLLKGSSIVDAEGSYVATAIEDGQVFLSDTDNLPKLYATDSSGQRTCQLIFALPKERDLNAFYENVTGTCQ